MKIRFANTEDSASILNIYAQYINTPITFECKLPSVSEFAERIADTVKEYPYLICEQDGRLVGYAYAHRYKERAAYQWNAELSVYIDSKVVTNGLGKKMYNALIDILKLQGVKTVYGVVTMPNEKSDKLHNSLGFRQIGTNYNTGYKYGKWHDVTWFEKAIAAYDQDPQPFVSVDKIAREELQAIILSYSD